MIWLRYSPINIYIPLYSKRKLTSLCKIRWFLTVRVRVPPRARNLILWENGNKKPDKLTILANGSVKVGIEIQ